MLLSNEAIFVSFAVSIGSIEKLEKWPKHDLKGSKPLIMELAKFIIAVDENSSFDLDSLAYLLNRNGDIIGSRRPVFIKCFFYALGFLQAHANNFNRSIIENLAALPDHSVSEGFIGYITGIRTAYDLAYPEMETESDPIGNILKTVVRKRKNSLVDNNLPEKILENLIEPPSLNEVANQTIACFKEKFATAISFEDIKTLLNDCLKTLNSTAFQFHDLYLGSSCHESAKKVWHNVDDLKSSVEKVKSLLINLTESTGCHKHADSLVNFVISNNSFIHTKPVLAHLFEPLISSSFDCLSQIGREYDGLEITEYFLSMLTKNTSILAKSYNKPNHADTYKKIIESAVRGLILILKKNEAKDSISAILAHFSNAKVPCFVVENSVKILLLWLKQLDSGSKQAQAILLSFQECLEDNDHDGIIEVVLKNLGVLSESDHKDEVLVMLCKYYLQE